MLPPFSYSNQYIQLCKPGIIINTAAFLLFRSTPKSCLFHLLNISRICPVFSFSTIIICFQAPIISFLNNYVTFYRPHLINSRLHISCPQKKNCHWLSVAVKKSKTTRVLNMDYEVLWRVPHLLFQTKLKHVPPFLYVRVFVFSACLVFSNYRAFENAVSYA